MDDKLLISCQFTLSGALRQHLVAQTGYFDLSIACFSVLCHLLAAKCAILCPGIEKSEIANCIICVKIRWLERGVTEATDVE
jgi:hypothetical protein